jgi:hypothetical protein
MLAWCFAYYVDYAFAAVDPDLVTGVQSYRPRCRRRRWRDAELACHDGGVGQGSADVGDHGGGPRGRSASSHVGHRGYTDVAVAELADVFGFADQPRNALGQAGPSGRGSNGRRSAPGEAAARYV